jgi:hypothetical protein
MSIGLNANNDGTGSIQIGGSDAIKISTGLNVGIGTASPTAPLDVNGNVAITGSARRITGDFSNATVANRVMFQTSTANVATTVSAIPNGTDPTSVFSALNASDPTNAGNMSVLCTTGESSLRASRFGTGTYLPMTFYTNGLERMRIDTSGNVGIGVTSTSGYKFAVGGTGLRNQFISTDATSAYLYTDGNSFIGSTGAFQTSFVTNNIERMRIDSSGNVLVTSAAGLGYGTGSGGTVTQATSKATAVTLNKPTGQITMNNAALNANTTVVFTVTNSLCAFVDTVSINHRNGASYNVWVVPGIGSFDVYLRNITAGSLSDAVVLNFSIIKGATS